MKNQNLEYTEEQDFNKTIANEILNTSFEDIFNQHNAVHYSQVMDQTKLLVLKFLNRNKKPNSGVNLNTLEHEFSQIDLNTPIKDYDDLFEEIDQLYIQHATAFHLPKYMAHLNCPIVIPALAAEMIISALNSSQDTYDQSVGGTFIEQKMIDWTAQQIGFDENSDGIFTTGGSHSNLMGLLLARDHFSMNHFQHNIKLDGNPIEAPLFKIFISKAAHFSNLKNVNLMGLGEKSIVLIDTDHRFRLKAKHLQLAIEHEIELGNIPIAIVGTAGTTDFGNIDPLEDISAIAQKYKLWFHVDAAYGCGLLLSDRYRNLLNGIEKADSVTIDYHKSFFQPISGSAFIVRDKNVLKIIKFHADYLNPKEMENVYPALINKSIIQTTRRFDALKVWFTIRLLGVEKLKLYIETIIETSKKAAHCLDQDTDFELLCHSDISVLVFRFINSSYDLCKVNYYIKKQLFESGEAMIASTKVQNELYLKFTLLNPVTTLEDIKQVLQLIKYHGNNFGK